jgi:hypothetical protein
MQCLEPICVHLKRLIRFLVEDQNLGSTEISLRCGQLDFFLAKTILCRHIPARPGYSSELFVVHHAMQVRNLPIDSKLQPGNPKPRMDQEV